jgi:hypothetical protein
VGTAGWCAGRTPLLLSFRAPASIPPLLQGTVPRDSFSLFSTFTFSLRPSCLSPTLPQPLSNCIAGSIHQKIFLPLEPGCSYIPYSTIITIILGRDTQCTREATPTDSEQHTIDSLYRLQAQHHHFILSNTRIAYRRIHFPKIHSFFQQSLNAGPFEKARNPEVLTFATRQHLSAQRHVTSCNHLDLRSWAPVPQNCQKQQPQKARVHLQETADHHPIENNRDLHLSRLSVVTPFSDKQLPANTSVHW